MINSTEKIISHKDKIDQSGRTTSKRISSLQYHGLFERYLLPLQGGVENGSVEALLEKHDVSPTFTIE